VCFVFAGTEEIVRALPGKDKVGSCVHVHYTTAATCSPLPPALFHQPRRPSHQPTTLLQVLFVSIHLEDTDHAEVEVRACVCA